MACDVPRILPYDHDLLLSPQGEPHPLLSDGSWDVFRESFRLQGLPQAVVELLVASIRPTTEAAYQSDWNSWCNWKIERDSDPLSNDPSGFLEYLTELHESGKSYSTINIHRSALSMTLNSLINIALGNTT